VLPHSARLARELQRRLRNYPIHGVAAGLRVMIELPPVLNEKAFVAAAARRSVRVCGMRRNRADPRTGPRAVIVGYGRICETDIPEAARQLALAIEACTP
jgi:DNA-binding transcriptional MocR family regulator